jgi:hypothetical protein
LEFGVKVRVWDLGLRIYGSRLKFSGLGYKGTVHVMRYKRVSGKGYRVSITAQGKLFRISD